MVHIHRTLSPSFYSRPFPHRPPSTAAHLRRLLILLKPPRKYGRPILRLSLFFLLGFLLGLSPFAYHPLPPSHDFSFDPPPPPRFDLSSIVRPADDAAAAAASFDIDNLVSLETHASPPPAPSLLIVVTPTYNRARQAYHLHRLAQTLRLVPPPLLWVVVETKEASDETARILRTSGVMYRHLVCRKRSADPKDRGVLQRNTALKHIAHHHLDGVLYFADDDNVYSLELFQRMREIRRFGTWPVAMLAQSKSKATLEGPVCNGSRVVGWHTNEKSKRLRRFHVDMSGFAFNSTILWDPKRWHRPTKDPIMQLDTVKEGFQETTFISQIVEDESQMEGIPLGCSKIMNWHLHLEDGHLLYPNGWQVSKNLDVIHRLN